MEMTTIILPAGTVVNAGPYGIPVKLTKDTEIECHPLNIPSIIKKKCCGKCGCPDKVERPE